MRSPVLLPLLATALALLASCRAQGPELPPEVTVSVPAEGEVVVYVEAPRYLAAPVLKLFSDQTGITVKATYREETPEGFLDRVRTEAAAGKVDLLWSVTPLSAIALAREGLALPFRPAGARPIPGQYRDPGYRWIGFAVNPRVIIFNHDLVDRDQAPQSVDDLTIGPWAGKAAVARAASGPAAFQAAALFARWGDARGREFYEGTRAVGNRVVETDEEVRRLVVSGEVSWGIVNLDQAICAKRQAEPVSIFFPDRIGPGAIIVPQAAVLLARPPHPDQARGLFGYLFATETAWQVGQNDCALISLLPVVAMGIPKPEWVPLLGAVNVMTLDNEAVYDAWLRNSTFLSSWGAAPSGG
jgi:iron(III) transport system substrate-binding protein